MRESTLGRRDQHTEQAIINACIKMGTCVLPSVLLQYRRNSHRFRGLMAQDPRAAAGPEQLLGELEATVMQVIWRRGDVTVHDVLGELAPARPLAYTTVMTIMSRLREKGILTARRQGKAYVYHATGTPSQFVAQRAQQAVQDVLHNFGDVALAQFLRELDHADPAHLASLRSLLAEESADVG